MLRKSKVYISLNMDSGDFCLHADPDGKAYIWFERPPIFK